MSSTTAYAAPTPAQTATNGTTLDLLFQDEGLVGLVSNFEVILAAASIIMLLSLLLFLSFTAPRGRVTIILTTKKNLLLMLLVLLAALQFGISAYYTTVNNQVAGVAKNISFAALEIAFIGYSWERAHVVFRLESSPRVYIAFHWLMWTGQVACLLPVVAILIPSPGDSWLMWSRSASILSGSIVLLLDIYFAVASSIHVFRRTAEITELKGPDAKGAQYYPIVARHVVTSSLGCILALGFFVGVSIVGGKKNATISDVYTHYLLVILLNSSLFFVCSTLVLMKVRLVLVSNEQARFAIEGA
ncbi:hypothetical protein BDR26DRAFT_916600 [Obelidium mucronatum]|nr:hypothetical protein BDR26DRAFT_916600 [Obelidium mucronatum]